MGKRGVLASFPGSPSFCTIIPRTNFDLPERKAEGNTGCSFGRVKGHTWNYCAEGEPENEAEEYKDEENF